MKKEDYRQFYEEVVSKSKLGEDLLFYLGREKNNDSYVIFSTTFHTM